MRINITAEIFIAMSISEKAIPTVINMNTIVVRMFPTLIVSRPPC